MTAPHSDEYGRRKGVLRNRLSRDPRMPPQSSICKDNMDWLIDVIAYYFDDRQEREELLDTIVVVAEEAHEQGIRTGTAQEAARHYNDTEDTNG